MIRHPPCAAIAPPMTGDGGANQQHGHQVASRAATSRRSVIRHHRSAATIPAAPLRTAEARRQGALRHAATDPATNGTRPA
jgi:hypothetical protein